MSRTAGRARRRAAGDDRGEERWRGPTARGECAQRLVRLVVCLVASWSWSGLAVAGESERIVDVAFDPDRPGASVAEAVDRARRAVIHDWLDAQMPPLATDVRSGAERRLRESGDRWISLLGSPDVEIAGIRASVRLLMTTDEAGMLVVLDEVTRSLHPRVAICIGIEEATDCRPSFVGPLRGAGFEIVASTAVCARSAGEDVPVGRAPYERRIDGTLNVREVRGPLPAGAVQYAADLDVTMRGPDGRRLWTRRFGAEAGAPSRDLACARLASRLGAAVVSAVAPPSAGGGPSPPRVTSMRFLPTSTTNVLRRAVMLSGLDLVGAEVSTAGLDLPLPIEDESADVETIASRWVDRLDGASDDVVRLDARPRPWGVEIRIHAKGAP